MQRPLWGPRDRRFRGPLDAGLPPSWPFARGHTGSPQAPAEGWKTAADWAECQP